MRFLIWLTRIVRKFVPRLEVHASPGPEGKTVDLHTHGMSHHPRRIVSPMAHVRLVRREPHPECAPHLDREFLRIVDLNSRVESGFPGRLVAAYLLSIAATDLN